MNPHFRKLSARAGQLALLAALFWALAGFGSGTPRSRPSPSFSLDARVLLKQFEAAQHQEMNGLLNREKLAAKHLKGTQAAKQKDFDRKLRDARRKFFAADHTGPEKRAYIKNAIHSREMEHQAMANASAQAKSDSDARIQVLRDEQQMKHQKFVDELRQNQRPDDSLWPQPTLETD